MALSTKPADAVELDDVVMSNLDHTIDQSVAEKLKSGNFYARYPGWDFHGIVWWDGAKYKCEIWRYRSHVNTLEGSLKDILNEACVEYGAD